MSDITPDWAHPAYRSEPAAIIPLDLTKDEEDLLWAIEDARALISVAARRMDDAMERHGLPDDKAQAAAFKTLVGFSCDALFLMAQYLNPAEKLIRELPQREAEEEAQARADSLEGADEADWRRDQRD